METTLRHDYAPFMVERGKIREFAQAIGLEECIYYSVESAWEKGFRDIVAPPTFGTVIDFWNSHDYYQFFEKLDLDPENVLHGEQSYDYIEDICAGDTISGNVRVRSIKEKGNKKFYYFETFYSNQDKKQVMIGRATLVVLGRKEKQV